MKRIQIGEKERCRCGARRRRVMSRTSEVDLLSLPVPLSPPTLTYPRALLRLTAASWPQRAWGMGPGAWDGWSAGDKGAGPLGYESVSGRGGGGIPGVLASVGLCQPMNDRHRQGTTAGMALAHFDREGPVEYWSVPPEQGVLVCSCTSTPIGTNSRFGSAMPFQRYYTVSGLISDIWSTHLRMRVYTR